ncbi:MAG: hypothetical protein M1836_007600 [Candelina mexicana]|nr:MAG: hypothetical protein M1836_007600 [Candelina mexicana]
MASKIHRGNGLRIAVEGCAVRNANDLNCMSVPVKYREIGDFHEYYSGKRKAPYLTIFVGGNHEASNHLWELYYGGWVAPNIYYLGAANVVRLGPLRIVGLSGIWKGYSYNKPHHERIPYNQDDVKSSYHVRELDVRKLLQIRTQVDIGISHDWPRGIEWNGDHKTLFKQKDGFEVDARAGTLGSTAAKYVMDRLRPPHWFSAHLHVKFAAVVEYGKHSGTLNLDGASAAILAPSSSHSNKSSTLGGSGGVAAQLFPSEVPGPVQNSEEIDLEMEDEADVTVPKTNGGLINDTNQDEIRSDMDNCQKKAIESSHSRIDSPGVNILAIPEDVRSQLPASFNRPTEPPRPPPPSDITNTCTHFLALDKCLPNRKFLQILGIEPLHDFPDNDLGAARPLRLEYDKEWLAITRVFASELTIGDRTASVPSDKGEAYYRPLIEKQENWIKENIVAYGKMTIPENFQITAPIYDPTRGPKTLEGPKEYTNPQTATFCDLLQIQNRFDATDEERQARLETGPRPNEVRVGGGGRSGGFRGGGKGGGSGGGRGRGRGRGRGFR